MGVLLLSCILCRSASYPYAYNALLRAARRPEFVVDMVVELLAGYKVAGLVAERYKCLEFAPLEGGFVL